MSPDHAGAPGPHPGDHLCTADLMVIRVGGLAVKTPGEAREPQL